jgi:prepilin-type N-terminal cleavage/methylation domain-containing protein
MEPAMMDHKIKLGPQMQEPSSAERGFSLIEVMIAIAILTVGLLGLVGTFATALQSTQWSQEDLIAKQKALESLESIYTARNTSQLTFAQVANVSAGGGAIFTDGYTQLRAPGPDGLVGTTDDVDFAANGPCAAGVEGIRLPGADGILGNADDTCMSLANFNRQILIVPVNGSLKQVTVNVQYSRPGMRAPRTYTVNALMSSYR